MPVNGVNYYISVILIHEDSITPTTYHSVNGTNNFEEAAFTIREITLSLARYLFICLFVCLFVFLCVFIYLFIAFYFSWQFEPYIQEGNEGLVHHMILYECHGNFNDSHRGPGYNCRDQANMPLQLCFYYSVLAAWAVGGQVGYSFFVWQHSEFLFAPYATRGAVRTDNEAAVDE